MKNTLVAILILTSFSAFSKECQKAFVHILDSAGELAFSEGTIRSGIKAGMIKSSEAADVISKNQEIDKEIDSAVVEFLNNCLPNTCAEEFKTLVDKEKLHGYNGGELLVVKRIGNNKNISIKTKAYSNEILTLEKYNENFLNRCL